ncbi:MAG: hypothetical protein AAGI66_05385 [Cyanobacteria bacterium P01_H01_bin.74]
MPNSDWKHLRYFRAPERKALINFALKIRDNQERESALIWLANNFVVPVETKTPSNTDSNTDADQRLVNALLKLNTDYAIQPLARATHRLSESQKDNLLARIESLNKSEIIRSKALKNILMTENWHTLSKPQKEKVCTLIAAEPITVFQQLRPGENSNKITLIRLLELYWDALEQDSKTELIQAIGQIPSQTIRLAAVNACFPPYRETGLTLQEEEQEQQLFEIVQNTISKITDDPSSIFYKKDNGYVDSFLQFKPLKDKEEFAIGDLDLLNELMTAIRSFEDKQQREMLRARLQLDNVRVVIENEFENNNRVLSHPFVRKVFPEISQEPDKRKIPAIDDDLISQC